MDRIRLEPMTKELSRQYHKEFELDPILFMDPAEYRPYIYSDEHSDGTVERYRQLGRVYMAVMLDGNPIGEVILKRFDHEKKCCTLGISMVNDEYKNKGYGTQAEKLILRYAFENLGMETVYADALMKNVRSQHVLKKVGFTETHRDDTFIYYRCDKHVWQAAKRSTLP